MSKVMSSYHKKILALQDHYNINLCWVPGHKNILGNEEASEFVNKCVLQTIGEWVFVHFL